MAAAEVQSTTGNGTASPTVTTAFGTATTTGNLIVVAISDDAANITNVTGVTDNKGNTYTKIFSVANSATGAMWYAKNITGGAAHTVSVAWTVATASRCTVVAKECSGCDTTAPLDKSTTAIGTSTAPSSGATTATTLADEIIIGMVARDGLASAVSLGAGYANLGTVNVADAGIGMESKVVAATGTQTATFSIAASRTWVCGVATFKGAGGGGGGGPSGATLGGFMPFL